MKGQEEGRRKKVEKKMRIRSYGEEKSSREDSRLWKTSRRKVKKRRSKIRGMAIIDYFIFVVTPLFSHFILSLDIHLLI